MKRVSIRTLVLMLELLVAVVSFQYMAMIRQSKPDVVWLAKEDLKAPHCRSTDILSPRTEIDDCTAVSRPRVQDGQ